MDMTMKLPHHDTPPLPDLDDLRKRNAAAPQLLQEWLADASGYAEEIWPLLKERLEAERTAPVMCAMLPPGQYNARVCHVAGEFCVTEACWSGGSRHDACRVYTCDAE